MEFLGLGRATVRWIVLAVAVAGNWRAHAADNGAGGSETASLPVVTRYDAYWQLGQTHPNAKCHVRARCFVASYYADWGALWVIWDGQLHYLSAGHQPLPIRAGEWIDLDATGLPSGQAMEWQDARITALTGIGPPRAELIDENTADAGSLQTVYAELEGVVDQQTDISVRYLKFNVAFGEFSASMFLELGPNDPMPQLVGSVIRATGVFSVKRDTVDSPPKFELWCPSTRALKTVGLLSEDPRFNAPTIAIDDAIARPWHDRVHVVGTVYRQEPGRSIVLRDGSGQVTVLTGQVQPMRPGDTVEAVGLAERDGLAFKLRRGRVRNSAAGPAIPAISVYRLAGQVRSLPIEEAARGPETRIVGVVTWSSPDARYMFVQDATGGVRVLLPKGAAPQLVGSGVTVRGKVRPGDFAPVVEATMLLPGGNTALPDPDAITREQAMTGAAYGGWVEMQGYVRAITPNGSGSSLLLTGFGGEFSAELPDTAPGEFVGAIVRLQGVCDAITNDRRQLTGIRLLVPGREYIQVTESAPPDLFATPVVSVGSLLRYNSATPLIRQVHVNGVVVFDNPGQLVCIEDGSDTATILSEQSEPLAPGDRIAAVGIFGQTGERLMLRDAQWRKLSPGIPPAPIESDRLQVPSAEFDGHLVRATGRLLSRDTTADGIRMQLQYGNNIFTARLQSSRPAPLPVELGSTLAVTGLYRVELDEYRRPRAFTIYLRSPADVVVRERPAWWTAARVLWFGGGLIVVVVVTLGWAVTLSRKNDQLRAAQLELRRANEQLEGRVEERTRVLNQEVKQRRASEATLAHERKLLRTLIDNLPVYLYVKDPAGRFVIDNLPHARLLGAATGEEVIGRTERDFWSEEIAAECRRSDQVVLDTGEPLLMHEERFAPGGEGCWHSITRVPLRDAQGGITGVIAISLDITARKKAEAERESLHRQVLETSRRAGMAEVATGVLHNVGNVLNSVNISASLAAERVARSRSEKLAVLIELLQKNRDNLGRFFAEDPRAQRVPEYLSALLDQLRAEQADVLKELKSLQRNVDHIKEIVAMQQSYAKVAGVAENVAVQEIVEDALRINQEGLLRHRIEVAREIRSNPVLCVERHKVLQILVNLISNAKYACSEGPEGQKKIKVAVDRTDGHVQVTVTDNGVGIAAANLTRIFSHGFTTRKNGHGFGLHSGALAAREMGGELRAMSDGPGQGATFILELPVGASCGEEPQKAPSPAAV